ncbi:heterokaryon incompatibility protein-domain-containing protein [Annulohypoxylon nitens]|nr:heterokaryon incompatibility protein-domain-containing protein [Annulohypoxylon nitens]
MEQLPSVPRILLPDEWNDEEYHGADFRTSNESTQVSSQSTNNDNVDSETAAEEREIATGNAEGAAIEVKSTTQGSSPSAAILSSSSSSSSSSFLSSFCELCRWTGDPLKLLDSCPLVTFEKISASECIRCQILALAIQATSLHKTGPHPPPRCTAEISFENIIEITIGTYSNMHDVVLSTTGTLRGILQHEPVCLDTSTRALFLWARTQIETYQHCCQPTSTGSFVPTRLINVTKGLRGDVYLDDCVPNGSRYVALSYCWGKKKQPCQTTASTLNDWKQNIPWATLPKTLQHAIEFTCKLGIKYLWVDCLCIVQGDREDWERESGRMFDVYGNSYVTLAAVWGNDSESGLFASPEDLKPTLLANLYFQDQNWPLYMRPRHELISEWDLYEGYHRAPLFTRAWAYQERLITPRILYFTECELAFECFCHTACECGLSQHVLRKKDEEEGSPRTWYPKNYFWKTIINHTNKSIDLSAQSNDIVIRDEESFMFTVRRTWGNIVKEYSSLNLTNLADKLLAIGAIARQFQKVRPREHYLAGLWSGSLYRDLSWAVMFNLGGQRTETAPTWSWASTSGGVFQVLNSMEFEQQLGWVSSIEVLDATCSYVDDNPFGVLKSSSLILRGQLTRSWLHRKLGGDGRHKDTIYHCRSGLTITFGVWIDAGMGKSPRQVLQQVYLLETAKRFNDNDDWKGYERVFLIIGEKSSERQVFHRLGILKFSQILGIRTGHENTDVMDKTLERFGTMETIKLI